MHCDAGMFDLCATFQGGSRGIEDYGSYALPHFRATIRPSNSAAQCVRVRDVLAATCAEDSTSMQQIIAVNNQWHVSKFWDERGFSEVQPVFWVSIVIVAMFHQF